MTSTWKVPDSFLSGTGCCNLPASILGVEFPRAHLAVLVGIGCCKAGLGIGHEFGLAHLAVLVGIQRCELGLQAVGDAFVLGL